MASNSEQEHLDVNTPGVSSTVYGSFASLDVSSRRQADTPTAIENHNTTPRSRASSRKWYGPRLILENSGSVARDHLASERTFLAYVRTSLALASAGVGKNPASPLSIR